MTEGKIVDKNQAWKRKIHFQIEKDGEVFYLCNQACATFPEKRTTNQNKVTCKNCSSKLKKSDIIKEFEEVGVANFGSKGAMGR